MADEGRRYSEHDDRVGGPAFRNKKGRGPFRGRMYSEQPPRQRHRGGGGWGPHPRARFEEDEGGDVSMNDALQDSSGSGQRRFNPYSARPNRRGEDRFDRERGGGQRGPRGPANRKSWFKITIPCGKKYDKQWLLSALQGLCSIPFTAVHFHHEKNNAVFFVEDATTANALKMVSRKITDKDSYKVVVIINSSSSPPSFMRERSDSWTSSLSLSQQCMSKRFDGSQQALDLNSLRTDPDLVTQNIDLVLNRRNCMQAVNKIIEENIPELISLNLSNNRLYRLDDLSELVNKATKLKSLNLSRNELKTERELDKIKGFQLEELWLDRNALCDSFKDHATYIR
ncbi:nuclear RNA export factor 1-like [Polyodon spathula]|uniref:nuclear RNA export factor 1-like n=1 Tax=Polyodon spathula TaxID=7913 RepID=UPI001B7F442C|nr:nuclear RNA export factor 1-like [Polyodon spathula]